MTINIRVASRCDFDQIWPFFRDIAAAGDTYAYPQDITRTQALAHWMDTPRQTYVAEQAGRVVGSYYIKTNAAGPGAHVCNCGYMVAPAARSHGIATAMCEHSQAVARHFGYKAMQFNFVAASNSGAIRLWRQLGFSVVGRLPHAFAHPEQGCIDALVMYKWLA